jgi:hypothetical protein
MADMGGIRFSLRAVFVVTAATAWAISLFMPGGIWIALPVGVAVISAISASFALRHLVDRSSTGRAAASMVLGMSLILLVTFLVGYLPFLPVAVSRRGHEMFVSKQRDYVLHRMPADEVLKDGRELLARLRRDSIKTVFSDSPIVPDTLQRIHPQYIEARDDCLAVLLGRQSDRSYLFIYPNGAPERGTKRLLRGLWFFEPGTPRWITDDEWDRGVRE